MADPQQLIHIGGHTTADTQQWIPAWDKQQQIHSGRYSSRLGYTMADIYTVADIQPDIQYQVKIHTHSGGYIEVVQDTQHDIHSGGYTAADTQQQIYSGR